ncbi:HpcH/HpaI aldolase/citrate lyase family protein [Rhodococcus sp. NPDC057529]|uniref:HpcH/HpaI aldolase/citrate lyase family protein n=1 Tax=Rhodococcus sp. NPDC057529 TaxID=3346158 RepID=UPI00366EED0F
MTSPDIATAVTWLFVPGTRPDRFAKAVQSGAHVIVVDLEDSVLPACKQSAREQTRRGWLTPAKTPAAIRINAHGSREYRDDVDLCRALVPAAVILPKTESAEQIQETAETTGCAVIGLIETARGFVNLPEIARSPQLARMCLGGIDLALDLGVSDDTALNSFRSDLVRWSAAYRLPAPIDGICVSTTDLDSIHQEAARAKAWGFGGKLCIHPAQVSPVEGAFLPTEQEVDWATRIVDAAGSAGSGALVVAGEMIDRPVLERAQRIVVSHREGSNRTEYQSGHRAPA